MGTVVESDCFGKFIRLDLFKSSSKGSSRRKWLFGPCTTAQKRTMNATHTRTKRNFRIVRGSCKVKTGESLRDVHGYVTKLLYSEMSVLPKLLFGKLSQRVNLLLTLSWDDSLVG